MTADNPKFIDLNDVISGINKEYPEVNSIEVVFHIWHSGDQPTNDLVRRMNIEDVQLRSMTRNALFSARDRLGIHIK